MSFIGYKVTHFLLKDLWLYKLFTVLWLVFMFFCGKAMFMSRHLYLKMECWYYLMLSLEPIMKCNGWNGWFWNHISPVCLQHGAVAVCSDETCLVVHENLQKFVKNQRLPTLLSPLLSSPNPHYHRVCDGSVGNLRINFFVWCNYYAQKLVIAPKSSTPKIQ